MIHLGNLIHYKNENDIQFVQKKYTSIFFMGMVFISSPSSNKMGFAFPSWGFWKGEMVNVQPIYLSQPPYSDQNSSLTPIDKYPANIHEKQRKYNKCWSIVCL